MHVFAHEALRWTKDEQDLIEIKRGPPARKQGPTILSL